MSLRSGFRWICGRPVWNPLSVRTQTVDRAEYFGSCYQTQIKLKLQKSPQSDILFLSVSLQDDFLLPLSLLGHVTARPRPEPGSGDALSSPDVYDLKSPIPEAL